jgi:hypothetical protein
MAIRGSIRDLSRDLKKKYKCVMQEILTETRSLSATQERI